MKFAEAFEALKQGAMIKLPSWAGYWKWEDNSIKMYCKDGRILDIRETEDVCYTLGNILREDWEVVNEADVKDLNIQTFMFGEALRHLKAGRKVARKGWKTKGLWVYKTSYPNDCCNNFPVRYCFGIRNSNSILQEEWIPSTKDLLEDDWVLVE